MDNADKSFSPRVSFAQSAKRKVKNSFPLPLLLGRLNIRLLGTQIHYFIASKALG